MAGEVFSGRGKVTIRDVAKDAGVSTAAVSKVLRDAYGVSDKLRDKVQVSIEKLGYRPSTAARGMRGRTYSIGLLLVEMRNPFLPGVVDGIKDVLTRSGYQLLIGVGEAEAAVESSLIDSMIDLKMDGVLLIAPRLSGSLLDKFAAQIPMAVIGHHAATAEDFDTINSNDETGAVQAVEALLATGRRDIQMISLPGDDTGQEVCHLRERGYLAAMDRAGLSDNSRIWRIRERKDRPGDPIDVVLAQERLPEGLFCWSDIHAVELLNLALTQGISVPEQLAVVGYDNSPVSAMPLLNLSSVEQHGPRLGALAAEALLSRIGGRRVAEHMLVQPDLVRRKSLGAPEGT